MPRKDEATMEHRQEGPRRRTLEIRDDLRTEESHGTSTHMKAYDVVSPLTALIARFWFPLRHLLIRKAKWRRYTLLLGGTEVAARAALCPLRCGESQMEEQVLLEALRRGGKEKRCGRRRTKGSRAKNVPRKALTDEAPLRKKTEMRRRIKRRIKMRRAGEKSRILLRRSWAVGRSWRRSRMRSKVR